MTTIIMKTTRNLEMLKKFEVLKLQIHYDSSKLELTRMMMQKTRDKIWNVLE